MLRSSRTPSDGCLSPSCTNIHKVTCLWLSYSHYTELVVTTLPKHCAEEKILGRLEHVISKPQTHVDDKGSQFDSRGLIIHVL